MDTLALLQHYWWLLVSLLGAVLVFLLFVQGGQSLLYRLGRTPEEKNRIVGSLGRKWELTFTTLVTFGGAFFASFPLFYSTSFGGAFYVWMAILLVFVIQAVSYEYREKAGNFLGIKTYDAFLFINGCFGPLLIGVAVGTFFTGANFAVDTANIGNVAAGSATISRWTSDWRGLEALGDWRNLALGVAVLLLARSLGLLYLINNLDDNVLQDRARRELRIEGPAFVLFFLIFFVSILCADGWAVDPACGIISREPFKYLHNLLAMPVVAVLLAGGVVSVLIGLAKGMFMRSRKGIWFAGAGTVATVLALLLTAGWNGTAYYPSLTDMQSSLTIYNSSSSLFTLQVMSGVSLLIPFVVAYIWYAWCSLDRRTAADQEESGGMMTLSKWAEAHDRDIARTLQENSLSLVPVTGAERQRLVECLYASFVSAEGQDVRPGILWDYLKHSHRSIDCGGQDPYWHFLEVIDGEQMMYFFLPDFYDRDFLIFRGRMAEIHTFVGDSVHMSDDYYLMTEDGMELYCVTHHNNLLHVDLRTATLKP